MDKRSDNPSLLEKFIEPFGADGRGFLFLVLAAAITGISCTAVWITITAGKEAYLAACERDKVEARYRVFVGNPELLREHERELTAQRQAAVHELAEAIRSSNLWTHEKTTLFRQLADLLRE